MIANRYVRGDDYRLYLDNLSEQMEQLQVALLSYCLMTNPVHLLVPPQRDRGDVSRLMRVVAARCWRIDSSTRTATVRQCVRQR
jgi:REP element-mobilizing transposase RayT